MDNRGYEERRTPTTHQTIRNIDRPGQNHIIHNWVDSETGRKALAPVIDIDLYTEKADEDILFQEYIYANN